MNTNCARDLDRAISICNIQIDTKYKKGMAYSEMNRKDKNAKNHFSTWFQRGRLCNYVTHNLTRYGQTARNGA